MQDAGIPGGSSWAGFLVLVSARGTAECVVSLLFPFLGWETPTRHGSGSCACCQTLESEAEFSNQEQLESGGLYLGSDLSCHGFLGAGGALGLLSVGIKLCSSHG